jgi:hypothetical protein
MRKVTRGVSPAGVVKLQAFFADKNPSCKDMDAFSAILKEENPWHSRRVWWSLASVLLPRMVWDERRSGMG